ncbi:hypothetical protein GLYMA_08G159750v4 [Glycine max]|nr:hypothetical protein GLYMA_08G159750v4 [Glycine max]
MLINKAWAVFTLQASFVELSYALSTNSKIVQVLWPLNLLELLAIFQDTRMHPTKTTMKKLQTIQVAHQHIFLVLITNIKSISPFINLCSYIVNPPYKLGTTKVIYTTLLKHTK